MKILRFAKTLTALVLTLTVIMLLPLQTVSAAENNGKYISEVYVAYGKDADEARKTLRNKGFTPVESNLNDGGNTYAMMGYKTTNNIRESITDLAVMNMNGDYSVEDYKSLLKKKKAEIAESIEELMAVVKEYRTNLKAGKTKAVCAHDLLNNYIDDDTGMKMGDLLNSETLQDKVGIPESVEAANPDKLPDLITILMQGNAQVIKSIEVLLSMATDTSDNTWIDRFAGMDYDAMLDKLGEERSDLNTESKRMQYLENTYGYEASVLGLAANDLRKELSDYDAMELHIDTAAEEDVKKAFGDYEKDLEAAVAYQRWVSTGTLYENLKGYEGGRFKKGELLEFFMKEQDPEDIEIFMPMAAALSEGQRYGMIFIDFDDLLRFSFNDEESWKKVFEEFETTLTEVEDVSVYQNIDRDLYKDDGSVALTGAARRANNTADGTTGDKENIDNTLAKITTISYMATATVAAVTGVVLYGKYSKIKEVAFHYETNSYLSEELKRIYDKKAYEEFRDLIITKNKGDIDYGAGSVHLANIETARMMVILGRVLIVTTMVLAVISTVLTIIEMQKDEEHEQLPIPKYMVDNYTDADGGSYTLNYKAVECNREEYFGKDYKKQKGNCADLCADEGKQWLVLYASKNSKAGAPIAPNIKVQDKNWYPAGFYTFKGVHIIGEKGAVNIGSTAFKKMSKTHFLMNNFEEDMYIYMFYLLSRDVKTYDEAAGNMTATAMSSNMIAVVGFGGLVLGGALGSVITALVKRKKKNKD